MMRWKKGKVTKVDFQYCKDLWNWAQKTYETTEQPTCAEFLEMLNKGIDNMRGECVIIPIT